MVPKSDHLANPRFDKKPSAQVAAAAAEVAAATKLQAIKRGSDERAPPIQKRQNNPF